MASLFLAAVTLVACSGGREPCFASTPMLSDVVVRVSDANTVLIPLQLVFYALRADINTSR